ncbi:phosphate ABC transporter substrate-binding protein PstS, partial [Roseisolibacter sp. H3M3-2]|uniref:phosphate ABC transporter substrate-binding protein PstS n=1 Tax=Roseisolibacter sp. H3M3-2 TaxID=3031323 RepID=UPI0023D9990D
ADDARPSAAGRAEPALDLTGAGATFPYPVYSRWISEYLARTGVRINYQSIGSGGGIRQLVEGTVDFGATDVPMSARELASAERRVLHVPTVLGAVAITYNLPGVAEPLRLSPEVLADVFLGRVRRWDDPRLAALNPGAALPDADILVVHRTDGSGTTYIVSDYLATVSRAWASGPGRGKDVRWPVGVGGQGNEGVAGQVKQTPGAIGYVEATYARQNRLPVAALRNRAGAFVPPTIEGVAAAAAAATAGLADTTDYRVSIVDAPGEASYPVASFTWLLLDPSARDTAATAGVVRFVRWALRDGAPAARELGYASLPEALAARVEARLAALPGGTGAP